MPALAEIGKIKRLAELLVFALKSDTTITAARNSLAINFLLEFGLSEKQADSFLEQALNKYRQGMVRPLDQVLKDVCTSFQKRDHGFILENIQAILEAGNITENAQAFFDSCWHALYHQ
jgi:hypothetical protein